MGRRMRAYVVVYRDRPATEAGFATSTIASREVLYEGPAEMLPLRRDWERLAAAEHKLTGSVVVRVANPEILEATTILVGDRVYRVLGVIYDPPHGYTILYGEARG